MHTFTGESCKIHYNSDMSGSVHIVNNHNELMEVSAIDLIGFISNYVVHEKISNLQNMSPQEVLGIPK